MKCFVSWVYSAACLALLLSAAGPAQATELQLATPPAVKFDGRLDEWHGPPSLVLDEKSRVAGAAGGRFGARVWLAQDAQGLWVAAQVSDEQVLLAAKPEQVLNSDHLELWLAAPAAVMPPLGYINQFAEVHLRGPQDCSEIEDPSQCVRWYNQQQERRRRLARLFVRQYLFGPQGVQEAWLGPLAPAMNLPEGLKPSHQSRVIYQRQAHGYTLEAHVDVGDFPAVAGPRLNVERLLVDFVDNDRGYSSQERFYSASPQRRFGYPASFLSVIPAQPDKVPAMPVSPPSAAKLLSQPGLFFRPGNFTEVFGFYNPGIGYQYAPSADSPVLETIALPRQPFARGQNVALFRMPVSLGMFGPGYEILAIRSDQVLSRFTPESICLTAPAPRYLSDNSDKELMLVAMACQGTASEFGSGTCGACPTWFVDVFGLDRRGRLAHLATESLWDDIGFRKDPELQVDSTGFSFHYLASRPATNDTQAEIETDSVKSFHWSDYLARAREQLQTP